jgi:hypothetical protein
MDVPRNQVILLVVGEMAFFFSVINEFHNVVKGQAEFLFTPPCEALCSST